MSRDPLISADRLQPLVEAGEVRLLDATWFLPDSGRDAAAEYQAGRLPGAAFFDIDAVADTTSGLPHMLPSPEAFAEAMGALGVSAGDRVVVYDRAPIPSAARVWWSLRVMGHEAVEVLDGGLEAWTAAGGRLDEGPAAVQPVAYGRREPPRPERVRDLAATRQALQDGSAQVVDARPAPRFRGEAAEPRAGLRRGHAPGALNLPASSLYGPDRRLLPPDALAARFRDAGVDVGRPVIASCGSGVTAASAVLALARLGRPDAAVYDGSWAEWGAHPDAPVVTGP